jgi:hypothetical protein
MEPNGPMMRPQGAAQAGSADLIDSARDPVRLQAAAVAAQQIAFYEEEAKLVERRAALAKQEEQLAAHLEEKRLKLLHVSERNRSERAALEMERLAHEKHVAKVASETSSVQRELLNDQKKVAEERRRLAALQRRLRQRWHRFRLAERHKYDRRQEEMTATAQALAEQATQLQHREQALTDKRLRFHALYELGRRRLRDAWQCLRQDQLRWKHRRGQERAALTVREQDRERAEQHLLEAQGLFIKEKRAWDSARALLQIEAEGLDARIRNQRAKIVEQQQEIARLDAEILARQQQCADGVADRTANPVASPQLLALQTMGEVAAVQRNELPIETARRVSIGNYELDTGTTREAWQRRFQDLGLLAGELADQRLVLLEQWDRLGTVQALWDKQRQQDLRELKELAGRLADRGLVLCQREQAGLQADQVLRHRHEELIQLRREMIAWRARLHVREKAWEGEGDRLLAEVRCREELADRHFHILGDLRQRWSKRRRLELERLRGERQVLDEIRQENDRQRLLLMDQTTSLEAEKRALAEKSLALEQHRQELLAKTDSAGAERRLERLRRRWLALHATAIRAAGRERDSLKGALLALASRHAELRERADRVAQAEADLALQQAAWEHQQTLAAARQARMQHGIQSAEAQRSLADQQVARMKDEIERIARALIDEPDPPTSEALTEAA